MKLFVSAAVATIAIAGTGLAAGGAPPITAKVLGAASVEKPFTVRTTKSAGLLTMQVTGAPGADFGWHYHPAAAAVIVAKGTLSVYGSGDPSCAGHPYSAGEGFIEPANHVHRARNEEKQPVVLYVTYLGLPSKAKSYVPAARPADCPA